MKRSVCAILLLVVALSCINYSCSESMNELTEEFDSLLETQKKIDRIMDIIQNGLPLYPEEGYRAPYAFSAETEFPDIPEGETGKEYAGMPYLLTGTCLAVKGYGIDFQLDDGRLAVVSFNQEDLKTKTVYDFGIYPSKNTRFNLFCTFSSVGLEMISKNCLHFTASVTEEAKTLCLQRSR